MNEIVRETNGSVALGTREYTLSAKTDKKKKPKNKNYVVVRINSALKKKQDNQNVTKNISSPKRQPYFGPELQIDKDLNVADIYDCEYIYMCVYMSGVTKLSRCSVRDRWYIGWELWCGEGFVWLSRATACVLIAQQ